MAGTLLLGLEANVYGQRVVTLLCLSNILLLIINSAETYTAMAEIIRRIMNFCENHLEIQ